MRIIKIIVFFLFANISAFSQKTYNFERRNIFINPIKESVKIGDTIYTNCYAEGWAVKFDDIKCTILDSLISQIKDKKGLILDIYTIVSLHNDESYDPSSIIPNKKYPYFASLNNCTFARRYLINNGIQSQINCYVKFDDYLHYYENNVKTYKRSYGVYNEVFSIIIIRDSLPSDSKDFFELNKTYDINDKIFFNRGGIINYKSYRFLGNLYNMLINNKDKLYLTFNVYTNMIETDSVNITKFIDISKSLYEIFRTSIDHEKFKYNIFWDTKTDSNYIKYTLINKIEFKLEEK